MRHLTYKVDKYPSTDRLTKDTVDQEIGAAFKMWEEVSALTFEKKESGSVNIAILFADGEHGDDEPFDGPGDTLAHAYVGYATSLIILSVLF